MKFPNDFEVVDGKIVHQRSREYQVGDDYITCRRCSTRRPADKMRLILERPVCVEHESNGLAYEHVKVQKMSVVPMEVHLQARQQDSGQSQRAYVNSTDAPVCASCGDITVRSGACYKCFNCGSTTGCS